MPAVHRIATVTMVLLLLVNSLSTTPVTVSVNNVTNKFEKTWQCMEIAQNLADVLSPSVTTEFRPSHCIFVLIKALSVINSMVTIVFDAPNLREMALLKQKFDEIEEKLSKLSLNINELKHLIRWNSAKVTYANLEMKIKTDFRLMRQYFDAASSYSTNSSRVIAFRREFVQNFQLNPQAAFQLYEAVVNENYVMATNLVNEVASFTKNDRQKVLKFTQAMILLILRGSQAQIFYNRLQQSEAVASVVEDEWKGRLRKLVTKIYDFDSRIRDTWHSQMQADMLELIDQNRGLSNSCFATEAMTFLEKKFPLRNWIVIAYAPVAGFNNHILKDCQQGATFFRVVGNRNFVVGSSDKVVSTFNKTLSDSRLKSIRNERLTQGELMDRMLPSCNSFGSFAASVCWDCDVFFTSTGGHLSYMEYSVEYEKSLADFCSFCPKIGKLRSLQRSHLFLFG